MVSVRARVYVSNMHDVIVQAGAGPFAAGDRVWVQAHGSAATILRVDDEAVVQVHGDAVPEPFLRRVVIYEVRLDNGAVRCVADRDGHLAPLLTAV